MVAMECDDSWPQVTERKSHEKHLKIRQRSIFIRRQAAERIVMSDPSHARSAGTVLEPEGAPHLTTRQLEVLALLCEGLPNKRIAQRLNISNATVKVHIGCILRELGVSSRLQAVVAAPRLGIVNEPVVDDFAAGRGSADGTLGFDARFLRERLRARERACQRALKWIND
jgi:ATP/maltotriose-dependent transcriptional regulator MalT